VVRVRFAPSPTGHLHIGGVRTALFNWLFARRHQGRFILRIEDTDLRRSKKRFLDEILESLEWLGLKWDEGPYLQSKRLKVYQRYAKRILDEGKAYQVKGKAIRFRVPPTKVKIEDLVHGPIEFDNSLLDDFIIQKSDGLPTYNFACCCDDHEMQITHVIRGDDHISNTPKQLALYQALNISHPKFAHIPLIMGQDRTRLSKRHGAIAITYYKKEGYLPQALINFLALLGWSPGEDREIVELDEIISKFSLARVRKTASIFNLDKLQWMNHEYIKKMDLDELTELLVPILMARDWIGRKYDRTFLKKVVKLFQGRMKTLKDITQLADYIFLKRMSLSRDANAMILKSPKIPHIFKALIERLSTVERFDAASVEACCRALIKELGFASGELIHPARAALTGRTVSPGLFELMELLGPQKVLGRLEKAIKRYRRACD